MCSLEEAFGGLSNIDTSKQSLVEDFSLCDSCFCGVFDNNLLSSEADLAEIWKESNERRERNQKFWYRKYPGKYDILLLDYYYDKDANLFYFHYKERDENTIIKWSNYSNLDIKDMEKITNIDNIFFNEFPNDNSVSLVKDKLLDFLETNV